MNQINPTLPTPGGDVAVWGKKNNDVHAAVIAQVNQLDALIAAMPETIRDTVGAALVAGSNVAITVNDAADTITIASLGGGGGGGTGGVGATVDGTTVSTLAFSTQVSAADVGALPLPSGTPQPGQTVVVSTASPLALAWGTPSGSGGGSTSVIRPETYGAKADAVILTDLVVTQGSQSITSASSPFTSTAVDAGKMVYWRTSGANYATGTILSVQSGTQATLAQAASAGIQTDGGPNPNSVFGTDNTAAFTQAYTAAQLASKNSSDFRKYVVTGREVRLQAGIYLSRTLPVQTGWNVRTVGEGMDSTWVAYVEDGSMFSLAQFNQNASYAFPSTTLNWSFHEMSFVNPVGMNGYFGVKHNVAIQDNGNGSFTLERVRFKGFKYGYASPYGGDFTRFTHVYFSNCDVGCYFGPGGQQVELGNCDWSDCQEGLVTEGVQNWHAGSNCHWQDPRISGITIEGKNSTTRFGVASNIGGGAWYAGKMVVDGSPWFETNSGNNGYVCPRMIWINGDGPYGVGAGGLVVRDAIVIAGGQQVPGGQNAFLEINTNYTTNQPAILDNINIGGTFFNYIVSGTGNQTNLRPLLKSLSYDTSKIALQRNCSGYKYISEDGYFHGYTAN